ncbi:hypothetical protein LTR62_008273 [Meristemomyces frigidus]|uniref:Phosphoglycerate mutase-like protein n=1 Tax=Meristemomyces frigidus TaxID=1508187 RepID=A0AAN7TB80_9PEZI|nr:hypothetical protein LTR62_008273 [Meristemomyces frigidus]
MPKPSTTSAWTTQVRPFPQTEPVTTQIIYPQTPTNKSKKTKVPDAPLTPHGRQQARSLSPQLSRLNLQSQPDLVVSSPLTRTLQTTLLAWEPAIHRLGGVAKIICLPQAQEVNDFPCDTGRSRSELEAEPEFKGLDFSPLTPEWVGKKGFWAPQNVAERARWVRKWLWERPEETIVVVAHGDVLRWITGSPHGASGYAWRNGEVRVFGFESEAGGEVGKEGGFWLDEGGVVGAVGGYGVTSTEMDLIWG